MKKYLHDGFSLVSFVIYLSAMTIIVSTGFHWLLELHKFYQTAIKKQRHFLEIHFVNDAFIRDIHTAPKLAELWEKQGQYEIGWKTKNGISIAWKYNMHSLTRIQKKWDKTNKTWGDTVSNTIINQIDDIEWQLIRSDQETIEGVLVSYTYGPTVLSKILIRTGIHE